MFLQQAGFSVIGRGFEEEVKHCPGRVFMNFMLRSRRLRVSFNFLLPLAAPRTHDVRWPGRVEMSRYVFCISLLNSRTSWICRFTSLSSSGVIYHSNSFGRRNGTDFGAYFLSYCSDVSIPCGRHCFLGHNLRWFPFDLGMHPFCPASIR